MSSAVDQTNESYANSIVFRFFMLNAAFTICSNNYLARARIASESFRRFHPEYRFHIVLVDRLDPTVDYAEYGIDSVIEASRVVDGIDELASRYDIVELNTAVKPKAFLYLFELTKADAIIYLDPDVLVTSRFTEVEALLSDGATNVVVTPHGCSPVDDGKYPSDLHISIYGHFNLGFLAVANRSEAIRFLHWWHDRLMKYCYNRTSEGMFTDQIWVTYAPIFFEGVHILKHLGYNVSHWNLYEREIALRVGAYQVSATEPLRFFHFSHYPFDEPYLISRQQNRHTIDDFANLRDLIDVYQGMLIVNRHAEFRQLSCYYVRPPGPAIAGPPASVRVTRKVAIAGYRAMKKAAPVATLAFRDALKPLLRRLLG